MFRSPDDQILNVDLPIPDQESAFQDGLARISGVCTIVPPLNENPLGLIDDEIAGKVGSPNLDSVTHDGSSVGGKDCREIGRSCAVDPHDVGVPVKGGCHCPVGVHGHRAVSGAGAGPAPACEEGVFGRRRMQSDRQVWIKQG